MTCPVYRSGFRGERQQLLSYQRPHLSWSGDPDQDYGDDNEDVGCPEGGIVISEEVKQVSPQPGSYAAAGANGTLL